jgi:excisionase family DNA binding protein
LTSSAAAPPRDAERVGFAEHATRMEPWISVDELALILCVSTDWIYENAASGELPSYKFGGHRRFRVSEVEDWASKCAMMSGGQYCAGIGSRKVHHLRRR